MKFKKSLILLLTLVMVFSCKQEEILDQNTGNIDLSLDISLYDNSNLGLYKGTFTTLDASERGIVEVKVLDNVPSRATLTLVSGASYSFKSIAVSAGQNVRNLKFIAVAETPITASFELSVSSDGGKPSITNAVLGNRASDILILKETSRGPIVTINGTWECDVNCLPNMVGPNRTFNLAGTGGTLTTQVTLDMAVFTGSGVQGDPTVQGGFESVLITGTVQVPQGVGNPDTNINFTATHRWRTAAPDCSTVSGIWDFESSSTPGVTSTGTLISDIAGPNCPPPGDTPVTAIQIVPGLEGDGCAMATNTVDLSSNGGFTDSGASTTCSDGIRDVWYSWTATSDGLTFFAQNASSVEIPGVSVWDATGTTELSCGDGSFGAISLSGWAINTPLLIRVAAGIVIPFCLEEFTVPVTPANNTCETAEEILTPLPATVMGNTASATDSDLFKGKDVWFTFDGTTEDAGDEITVSLCGSNYDTWLGVYTDCTYAFVASNDDAFGICSPQSQVTFINDGVSNYVIGIDGFSSGDFGAFTMNISSFTPVVNGRLNCGDTIIDSGGISGPYSDNEFETYIVDAGENMAATVSFTEFFVEEGWDYMRFYDGPDSSSARIAVSDGGVSETALIEGGTGFTGGSLLGESISSSGQFLTVTFFSDFFPGSTGIGYIGNITCALPLTGDTSSISESNENNRAVIRTEAQIIALRKARRDEFERLSAFKKYSQK
jgi:hypothetical protein